MVEGGEGRGSTGNVLRTEDMTATQGFSSGLFGLRTRNVLSGGRRIGLFGMVGSRELDCPVRGRHGFGCCWRSTLASVQVSKELAGVVAVAIAWKIQGHVGYVGALSHPGQSCGAAETRQNAYTVSSTHELNDWLALQM